MSAVNPDGRPLIGRSVRLDRLQPDDAPALFAALDDERVYAQGFGGGPAGRPSGIDAMAMTVANAIADPTRLPYVVRLLPPASAAMALPAVGDPEAATDARAHAAATGVSAAPAPAVGGPAATVSGAAASVPADGGPAAAVSRVRAPAGLVVGTTSILDVVVADEKAHIGWTGYSPAVWSSAVNPECKLLLLTHLFEECGFGRVKLQTDILNVRSQQAIRRLGAVYEGTLRRHRRRADGSFRDTVVFSILIDEWPAVRAGLLARLSRGATPASGGIGNG